MRRSGLTIGCLALGLALLASPASAQWYDDEEAPAGEGEILNPFSFKNFALASGFQISNWISPGEELIAYTGLLRGGYAFESIPIYIGLELPVSYIAYDAADDSEFALGAIGLNFKGRVDPTNPAVEIFTGWSIDLYIPTFMGEFPNNFTGPAAATTMFHTLEPGLHQEQEAINLVGTFDFVVPGHMFFFQMELSVGLYIPVTEWNNRDVTGGVSWGGALGWNAHEMVALLVELKGYTPLGVKDATGAQAPTILGVSPGLRMHFGPFEPAVWVTFACDENFRRAWPDVIIGVDLGLWF